MTKGKVGTGISSDLIEPSISREMLNRAMKEKIYNPERYLPVNNVVTEDKGDHVWRRMHYVGQGFLRDRDIEENIYWDDDHDIIRFVTLDDQGEETNEEEVNELLKDHTGRYQLHYYLRDKRTGEVLDWDAQARPVRKAIDLTLSAAQEQMV